MLKEDLKLSKFQYLLLYFFIYSFIGWIMETIFAFSIAHTFVKRGFLFGPLCPIYGCGGVILITFLDKYKKNKVKLFFMAILVFTVFEYISGYALDALFGLKWWDYTYDFCNLNSRIALFYSLAWGIIAVIFIELIHPPIQKKLKALSKKVSDKYILIGLKICFVFFVIDIALSSIKYFNIQF